MTNRTELTATEQIRIAALQIAARAVGKVGNYDDAPLIRFADRLARWIEDQELR
jgi:hypothetical protein